jgi:hypothetical protein
MNHRTSKILRRVGPPERGPGFAEPHERRLAKSVAQARRILLLCLVAVAICACNLFSQDDHPVLMIENRSAQTVDIFVVTSTGEERIESTKIGPGQTLPYDRMGRCLDAVLVARDQQGREVDRSDTPICRPSIWIIDGAGASP